MQKLSEAELKKIADQVRATLKDDLANARKWFWAAIATALAAGIGQIVTIVIAKCLK